MSLGKGLDDVNLLDSPADKTNQNVIWYVSQWWSMTSNIWSTIIKGEINSVADESTCSIWVEQNSWEGPISCYYQGGFTRSRKLTMKGLLHNKKTLRRKINSRLIRKYGTTKDLFCSSTNKVPVAEEMNHFNHLLKMLHEDKCTSRL